MAQLIPRIAAQEPKAIALDVLLPEGDRPSLDNIQKSFKQDFGIDETFTGVPAGFPDNDGFLGRSIPRASVVGSRCFHFDHATTPGAALVPRLCFDGRADLLALNSAPGVLFNADAIASQTGTSGFINTLFDDNGVLRTLPLPIRHDGVIHPTLSLAASTLDGHREGHDRSGALR